MTHDEKYQAVKAKIQELLPTKEWERDTGAPVGSGYLEQIEPGLADVLRALLSEEVAINGVGWFVRFKEDETAENLGVVWSFTDDRLSQQDESTIDFLYQTLVANE